MAGENPFEQYQMNQGQDLRTQGMQMRMMMNADRMSSYGMPRTRFAGSRGGMGQDPMVGMMFGSQAPDYSPFTYNPAMRAQAQAAGVNPLSPSQVNPNAFLPGHGFFGNHPKLAGMLEGGLIGAATTRGSDTIGEGISNVASSVIEGPQIRKALWQRQFAGPFQTANVVEGLQDKIAMRQEREETTQLRHTQMEYENEKLRQAKEQGALFKQQSHQPVMVGDTAMEPNPNWNPTAKGVAPYADGLHGPEPAWRPLEGVSPKAPRPNWAGVDEMRPFLQAQGVTDPDNATPAQWEKATKDTEEFRKRIGRSSSPRPPQQLGVKDDGSVVNIMPGMNMTGVRPLNALEGGAKAEQSHRAAWLKAKSANMADVRTILGKEQYNKVRNDPKATQKALEDFYDQNVANSPADYTWTPEGLVGHKN